MNDAWYGIGSFRLGIVSSDPLGCVLFWFWSARMESRACSQLFFFRFQPLQSTLVLGVQHFAQFAPGLVSGEVVEGCVTSKKNPQKHEKKVEKLGVHWATTMLFSSLILIRYLLLYLRRWVEMKFNISHWKTSPGIQLTFWVRMRLGWDSVWTWENLQPVSTLQP